MTFQSLSAFKIDGGTLFSALNEYYVLFSIQLKLKYAKIRNSGICLTLELA